MVKSGLEKIFLKFLHAGDYFPLLHKSAQNHKFSDKNNYLLMNRSCKTPVLIVFFMLFIILKHRIDFTPIFYFKPDRNFIKTDSVQCSKVGMNTNKILLVPQLTQVGSGIGMPIPRRFSFLGDLGNRGMAICHSSGIGESKIYSPGFGLGFGGILGSTLFQISSQFEISFY